MTNGGNSFVPRDQGRYELNGRLTFDTVPQFFGHTPAMLGSGSGLVSIDLRGVTLADSAGIALLVEWLRLARAAGRPITFVNIPEQVLRIIRISGLQNAFQIE